MGEFGRQDPLIAISNLNTHNFTCPMLGLLLHWWPRGFLRAVGKAVPATTGVLMLFPLYGGIAAIMTGAAGHGGWTVADLIARALVDFNTTGSFPVVMGAYSAVIGFFIPSDGGK